MNTVYWMYIQNIIAIIAAATVIGLYAMGAGGWAASGFLFLLTMSHGYTFTRTKS